MSISSGKASLNPRYLFIAAGPAIIYTISAALMNYAGQPFDIPPERIAEFDIYKMSAARTSMLGALMLFVGAGAGALCFFVYTLRMLDPKSRVRTIIGFLLLAASAVLVGKVLNVRDAQDYVGRTFYCIAAHYDQPASAGARNKEWRELRAPAQQGAGVSVRHLNQPANCGDVGIWYLAKWQFYLVALSFSGLMFGAICCLATPSGSAAWFRPPATAPPDAAAAGEPGTPPDPELEHWEQQSQWLNVYLYLAALLLGTAMLFINLYLRFPAHLMLDPAHYEANVVASVSLYGFVFTLMLGAFYIPVALILSNRVKELKPAAPGDSRLPEAFRGPLQLLKIVLGLFSTALAGVLPAILGMGG